jgi:hypothetical protein
MHLVLQLNAFDRLDNVESADQLNDFMTTVPVKWQLINKGLIKAKFEELDHGQFEPVFQQALNHHQFDLDN